MFGPALTSAVHKARESAEETRATLSNELHTADRMRHEADELDADQAEEVIEDEYRPLMADESAEGQDGGSSDEGERTGERASRNGAKPRRRWDEGEDGETKVRRLEVWLAQGIFFVLGACILLSWNTTIVAGSYYGARLAGSPFEASFASFNALTFTTANLVFLAHANATQGKADLSRRISWSILVLAANLALFIISTKVKEIPPALFFAFLIVSSIILAASASYLQNAVVALSASFGPSYLNQILSGQGAIGFAVAMIQFVAAYGAVKNAPKEPSHDLVLIEDNSTFTSLLGNPLLVARAAAAPPEPVRQSAFTFFLTVGLFAAASFVCYIVLIRLPLYRLVIRASFDSDAQPNKPKDASSSSDSGVSLRVVERKVRHLGVAMFLVFGITLAVFPSITSTIVSVKSDDPDARILQRSELFVPLGFAAAADERHSEKWPRSPRPRSPRPRSPAGRRHPDPFFDSAGGLPYDGEPELPATGRSGEKSSRWDRPSSPPPRHGGDPDRLPARFQLEEDERKHRAMQTEAARYGNFRSDDRRAFETTPVAYRSGGYDHDGRYSDYRNRYGYSTQYPRPPTGPYDESGTLDYGDRYNQPRSPRRHHDERSRRLLDQHRDGDAVSRTRDDRRRDAHRDPNWSREDDQERPSKRPRRDSASSSSKRDAAPTQAKKRDRSTSLSTDIGSSEEGEIDEHEKSILDDSSHQRVNDRLTQKTGHHESERSHSPYGARDGDRQRDRDRDRDREYNRRPSAPPPHLPSRPNPPNPSLPVPPRLAPPYNTPTARDANALPPRPLNAPSLPAKPHVVGVQPMAASSSSGRQADRPPTHGAALPLRPPPPPEAPLERPQAPYHPAVPISANVADVTPVESAAPSRALTPAVPAMTAAVEHAPPAVRTQRPHEELWLRTLQPDEEIEGVFSAATTPAPPLDRKYVGCSHISEYTLQEKLGEGTFGVVWKGRRGGVDPATNMSADEEAQLVQRGLRVKRGDVVALKQIIFHNEGDGLPITSVREIRILKMLDHPNVVPVVDIAYEPADHANFKLGKTFMVFPYMDHDLAGLLENRIVRLETAHIKQYSKQLLEGTAYLHRNLILHRDMKAANLLINNQGQLMIADFGLARSIHKAEENAAYTSCVVTRWYRPPELLLGEKRYHTPVDMWGVACVMAEMYQRSPIFPGQSDFDQAVKIFAACGPPTSDSMPGWEKLPGVEGHEKYMWPNNGRSIRAEWSTRVDELFGDLIDRILVLDPKKRLTAEEALDHDWFWTEPYPTDPARMPQYKASHEMDGRKRKEEQHAAFGAVPMPPFPQQQQQPNGMRSNVPIPNYGAPPIAAYNGGQVAAPPLPPPVGVFNGPPPATMAAHGYPGPQQQQQPPPPQMGGYGAAGLGPGPSGMAAGMGMGGGGYRPPPHGGGGGPNHNHNHSYAAPGPPIATAGGGMQPRRMGLGAGQYEGMRQGPSWNPHANVPARPGPPAKVNLMDKFKKQR